MRFVNRERELAALQRWWNNEGAASAVVWGRRRVGKTALIQHFAQDRRCVFHTGAARPVEAELTLLSRQVANLGTDTVRDLSVRPYRDWDEALDHLAHIASEEPLLLVLDEFPELVTTAPDLPGILRAFLDRTRGRTRLRLLLCGSAVRYMEALQEQRKPLYGRFDLTLAVQPFGPAEAAKMLPELSGADAATVYGLLGGVPLYLTWWDQSRSISENLYELACAPGARLLTEGQLVLATEAEHGEYPSAALYAIANGRTKYSEIKQTIQAEPARTLERLQQLRLVEKVVPVTETARTRRACYHVSDNFLQFYLGILSRFRADIERGLGDGILPVMVESLDDHLGDPWEEMVRMHLRQRAASGEFGDAIVALGPWWNDQSDTEIDIVALAGRSRVPVLAGEVKWARRQDAGRLVRTVRAKATRIPGVSDVDELRIAVSARERLDNLPADAIGVTAEDVFGA